MRGCGSFLRSASFHHGLRRGCSCLVGLVLALPSTSAGQTPEPPSACTEAAAVDVPCAGVLLPREWAIEAAACKKALPVALDRIKALEAEVDKQRLAKADRAWYAETWAGFLVGIPTGIALVWIVQEFRK